jgi:hypothetical protein
MQRTTLLFLFVAGLVPYAAKILLLTVALVDFGAKPFERGNYDAHMLLWHS